MSEMIKDESKFEVKEDDNGKYVQHSKEIEERYEPSEFQAIFQQTKQIKENAEDKVEECEEALEGMKEVNEKVEEIMKEKRKKQKEEVKKAIEEEGGE